MQPDETLCILPNKQKVSLGVPGYYAMAITYKRDDIASLTNLLFAFEEEDTALVPKEMATPPSREQMKDAQNNDSAIQSIKKSLLEIHELCQPTSQVMEDGVPFNIGTIPIYTLPLNDIELLINASSATKTAKRAHNQLIRRYRLDSNFELVYVRPKSRSQPNVHQTNTGDLAVTRTSGPSTNEAVLIPNSDEALPLRVQCIRWCHNSLMGGSHHGPHSTYARCRARFHWTNMQDDVRSYYASCVICKKAKSNITSRMGLSQFLVIAGNI
jgi:hypothetical protein